MRKFSVIFIMLIILPAAASAEDARILNAPDSVCVNFSSASSGLYLRLKSNYTVSGELPFSFCDLRKGGDYRIGLYGDRYEDRKGRMEIGGDGIPSIRGARLKTAAMNALLPGMGSYLRGRSGSAVLDFVSESVSLYRLYDEHQDHEDLEDRLDGLKEELSQAGTLDEKAAIQEAAHKASIDLNIQNSYRRRLAYLSSYLYAYQIIEPLLLDMPPAAVFSSMENELMFEGAGKKTWKAFLFSCLRPGRGQFYQGKEGRGIFFSSAVMVSGFIALDLYNQYDIKAGDYDLCVERFRSADTIEERSRYLAKASSLWDEVEDSKRDRDIALYVLAGIWSWNLIDTLFQGEAGSVSSSGHSFMMTPKGCEIAIRF